MLLKTFPKPLKKNRNSLIFYEKSRLASYLGPGQITMFIQQASLPLSFLSKWRKFFLTSLFAEEPHLHRSAAIFKRGEPLTSLATTGYLVLHFPSEVNFLKVLAFFSQQEFTPVLAALCYKGVFLNLLNNVSPYVFLAEHLKARSQNYLRFCEKLLAYSHSFTSFFFYFSYFSFFIIVLLNQALALIMLIQNIYYRKQ